MVAFEEKSAEIQKRINKIMAKAKRAKPLSSMSFEEKGEEIQRRIDKILSEPQISKITQKIPSSNKKLVSDEKAQRIQGKIANIFNEYDVSTKKIPMDEEAKRELELINKISKLKNNHREAEIIRRIHMYESLLDHVREEDKQKEITKPIAEEIVNVSAIPKLPHYALELKKENARPKKEKLNFDDWQPGPILNKSLAIN